MCLLSRWGAGGAVWPAVWPAEAERIWLFLGSDVPLVRRVRFANVFA
jgi:hypothetical protein